MGKPTKSARDQIIIAPTVCEGTIYVEAFFWRAIGFCQDDDFSQELHACFSRTMPGLILHKLQQRGWGKKSTSITATIDIFSSQRLQSVIKRKGDVTQW